MASLGPAPPDVPPTEDKGLKDRTFPMTESAGFVAGEEASGNALDVKADVGGAGGGALGTDPDGRGGGGTLPKGGGGGGTLPKGGGGTPEGGGGGLPKGGGRGGGGTPLGGAPLGGGGGPPGGNPEGGLGTVSLVSPFVSAALC